MLNTTLYAAPGVPDGTGDGTIDSPFSLQWAISTVPTFPLIQDPQYPDDPTHKVPDTSISATIVLATGDYGSQWLSYEKKRITFVGPALSDGSTEPAAFGVRVAPTFATGGAYVEFERTDGAVQPATYGSPSGGPVTVVARDARVQAWGTHAMNFVLSGTSPQTTIMAENGDGTDQIQDIYANNATIVANPVAGTVTLATCLLLGGELELHNGGAATSVLDACTFNNTVVTTAHSLILNACLFEDDYPITFATTGDGIIITDNLTYARGIKVGSIFPASTIILDQCASTQLTPSFVAAGAGVNSTGNLTLSYPDNAAGDLFIAQLNCAGGTSVPSTPSGWTLQYSKANAGIVGYVYTRVARSSGGETGTVTWSMPTDGAPKQGSIYSFRNVATSSFIESETDFTNAQGVGQGPTITPAGPGRLACVFFASNYDAPLTDPITGNTGGTWQFRFAQYSGIYALLELQTAELTANTAISGGSCSLGGGTFKVAGIAFALVGATG